MKRAMVLVGLAGFFFMSSMVIAQEKKEGAAPVAVQELRHKALITLKAQNSPLSEVLQILAEKSGLNFVTGKGVESAKITIILNNTPLDEAINLVVRAAGLAYEIVGNSILIAEPANLKDEVGQAGHVVNLKYADAAEVAVMLADLTANIKVDKGGNRLICFTSPRVILEIERIVQLVDHANIQIMLETRILEVSEDNAKKYGIDWSTLSSFAMGTTHPAVLPEAGFERWYHGDKWQFDPLRMATSLDMLFKNGDARILMDSKLSTMNNRAAKLHIGDVIPYVIQNYSAGSTGASQEIKKEEVGVKISMTPHINDVGEITLTLEPEVSSITGWKGANADLPLVRVRKTSTTVRVADGELVMLAGLLAEDEVLSITRFPLLGYIPYLGRLFQHRSMSKKKTNLVIEVRPHIIKATQAGKAQGQTEAPAPAPKPANAPVKEQGKPAAPAQQPAQPAAPVGGGK